MFCFDSNQTWCTRARPSIVNHRIQCSPYFLPILLSQMSKKKCNWICIIRILWGAYSSTCHLYLFLLLLYLIIATLLLLLIRVWLCHTQFICLYPLTGWYEYTTVLILHKKSLDQILQTGMIALFSYHSFCCHSITSNYIIFLSFLSKTYCCICSRIFHLLLCNNFWNSAWDLWSCHLSFTINHHNIQFNTSCTPSIIIMIRFFTLFGFSWSLSRFSRATKFALLRAVTNLLHADRACLDSSPCGINTQKSKNKNIGFFITIHPILYYKNITVCTCTTNNWFLQ